MSVGRFGRVQERHAWKRGWVREGGWGEMESEKGGEEGVREWNRGGEFGVRGSQRREWVREIGGDDDDVSGDLSGTKVFV